MEPFAGGAGYATRYSDREVILVEREPVVASLWRWLIQVSVDEVMGLPLDPLKRHTLAPEPCALIGFWCGRGRTQPANTTTSAWLLSGKWPSSFWGEYARRRIAQQVPRIRHWRLIRATTPRLPTSRPRGSSTRPTSARVTTGRASVTTPRPERGPAAGAAR